MKHKLIFTIILVAILLPVITQLSFATGPDTLWTRKYTIEINGGPEEGFEFHPTNDSIFIYNGRTYINGVRNDTFAVHFVNTVSGQEYMRYGPIHHAHYTPDGNFLIGHNDSTIAYISLDSMKPVRSYPIMKNGMGNFTIDERGKYVYTTSFTDTNKKFGFFRWSIDSGTVEQINLPDSLFRHPDYDCPTKYVVIRKMYASDTAKILLMSIFVNRPEPFCPAETRIWGIDLNADTVKYDLLKLDSTIQDSGLDYIFPKAVRFIGNGWRYDHRTGENIPFMNVYDVATGDSLEKIHGIFSENYTFSEDETYSISSDATFFPNRPIVVYNFITRDTIYIYDDDLPKAEVVISPNNQFLLLKGAEEMLLYPTPWFPTSIAEPKEDIPLALIYPNPAYDYIEINSVILSGAKIRENGEAHPVVLVYNVLGGKLMDSRLRGNDNLVFEGSKVRIDVSSLSPGVYFVRIGDKVLKFIKI